MLTQLKQTLFVSELSSEQAALPLHFSSESRQLSHSLVIGLPPVPLPPPFPVEPPFPPLPPAPEPPLPPEPPMPVLRHMPASHASLGPQGESQAPQFAGSTWRSTQLEPHFVVFSPPPPKLADGLQSLLHAPAKHT
jgi:hypothetical protein